MLDARNECGSQKIETHNSIAAQADKSGEECLGSSGAFH